MSKSMDIIAGSGVDHKTKKSHWPARLDFAQTASGLFLGLFMSGLGSGPVMYGAGYVTQGEWWSAGFIMSIPYLAVWIIVGPLWWMPLGYV